MSAGFEIREVVKRFGRHAHAAVDGVSLDLPAGRVVGVIGESGSGKSTLGRMICALERPTSGQILFDGVDLAEIAKRRESLLGFRRAVQLIGQDTTSSFDPRHTLRESILFPAVNLLGLSRSAAHERADELLVRLGLDPALADRSADSVSGGQRQRFAIARALILEPRFLVCDEVVSALDVSVQGGILNFLKSYSAERGAGIVFISHGLPATAFVSAELAVMKQGRILEHGPTRTVVRTPSHPYTVELLAGYPDAPLRKEALHA